MDVQQHGRLALVAPGAAQAATKSVSMGPPPGAAKTSRRPSPTSTRSSRARSRSAVGDSVRFAPVGFHDVHFLGRSRQATTPFIPSGKTIAGVNDEAGASLLVQRPGPEVARQPEGLHARRQPRQDPRGERNQGDPERRPLSDKPKPMVVRFTKAGLFRYVCDIHPGMKGAVRVVSKRRPVPSARRSGAGQPSGRQGARRRQDVHQRPGAGQHDRPRAQRARRGELVRVRPGQAVRRGRHDRDVQDAQRRLRDATATVGPGQIPEKEPKSYLGELTASLESPAARQEALYPSDLPPAPAALTPTLHGNGFWNSGALDSIAASRSRRQSQVTFAAAWHVHDLLRDPPVHEGHDQGAVVCGRAFEPPLDRRGGIRRRADQPFGERSDKHRLTLIGLPDPPRQSVPACQVASLSGCPGRRPSARRPRRTTVSSVATALASQPRWWSSRRSRPGCARSTSAAARAH